MGPKAVLAAAAAFSAALLASVSAQAAVTVLGAGAAHDCSVAAQAGMSDVASMRLCTDAIDDPAVMAREKAGTYVNRGIMKLRVRDLEGARDDFEFAIRLDPTVGEAYVNRGAALIAQRRYEEGLADIDRGLALDPKEPEKAWFNRGLAHARLDDLTAAHADFRKAAELNPRWPDPQIEMQRYGMQ